MKNLLLTFLFIPIISFVAKGQIYPDDIMHAFTFYKPQPQLSILKGISSPASHPDFDWFEPETFTPPPIARLEYASYRVFSLNGALLASDVEVLSISTDGLSERKVGTSIQTEAVKGIRISTENTLKPLTFPITGAKDIKFFIGIPSTFAKETLGMTINLKAQVKKKGSTVKSVNLQLQLTPGGGNPGI